MLFRSGPRVRDLIGMERGSHLPGATIQEGVIIWVDRFGNLISGIDSASGVMDCVVGIGGKEVPLVTHYAEGPRDAPAALVNSDGLVEIFVNRGDASQILGASIGTPVSMIPRRLATGRG